MKKLSLKWKIILAGLIPAVLLTVLGIIQISQVTSTVSEADKTLERIEVMAAASAVVHESQKERGKTAVFLSGGTTLEDLQKQRDINSEKIQAFLEILDDSPFEAVFKEELKTNLGSFEGLRDQVNSKSVALGDALKFYTVAIESLLNIQTKIASETLLPSVSLRIKSLRLIEDAKESGGKLRANISAVLTKNEAITEQKLNTILSLKAGVDVNLNSSSLKFGDEEKRKLDSFFGSDSWATVNSVFTHIIKNSEKGDYNKDGSEFFETISEALNIVEGLVNSEKSHLEKEVQQIKKEAEARVLLLSGSLGFVCLCLLFLLAAVVRSSVKSVEIIKNIGFGVFKDAEALKSGSDKIAAISSELSESSTEQAAGLQETVASIDEISSMVEKNAEAANASKELSVKSEEAAVEGKQNIVGMMTSMRDISESNDQIIREILSSNEEITKIVDVISEIGNKTQVINDIVFQTKLLSFNASVEAARAGEHGKGFAVVAEEVGNLASMSGKAALEITDLLNSSIKEVTEIVETAKTKADTIMKEGKGRVDQGLQVAAKCGESLDLILQNVKMVNSTVEQIATASSEQSVGIRQVTTAMQQLDQATHQNTLGAQRAAGVSKDLNDQAEDLTRSIDEMMAAIEGTNNIQAVDHFFEESVIEVSQEDQPENVIPFEAKYEEVAEAIEEVEESNEPPAKTGTTDGLPSRDDSRFE